MSNNQNTNNKFDVLGIGNAIVDVLSFTDDKFLEENNLTKGSMTLVDEQRAREIYRNLGQTTECSGGSVANSLAGLASLGAKTAFIGKVKNDQLGAIFTHDLHAIGVYFESTPATDGAATAHCMICVTPDAQRTMMTYLGACSLVSELDNDEALIANSKILYIEGYLWDTEDAKSAIRSSITLAKQYNKKVAFTLSDTFCVQRHRDEFLGLVNNDIDILFANEDEIKALYETDDFDNAVMKIKGKIEIAAITRSEKGSIVVTEDTIETAPAEKIHNVVDTTGAGDLYASGFLFGVSRGWDLLNCAELGNKCAGRIITQLGARSQKPLDALVA
ncbi:MAG: adenosine kinase [Rickettsiales bacterium]